MGQYDQPRTAFLVTIEGDEVAERTQQARERLQELGASVIAVLNDAEADWFSLPLVEQQRQRRLDAPIPSFTHEHLQSSMRFRIANSLWARGIQYVRDALVLGRRGTGLTPAAAAFWGAIAEHYPQEEILEQPTPTDIARVCFRPDQVNAGAIRPLWHYVERGEGAKQRSYPRITVDQLLTGDLSIPDGWRISLKADIATRRLEAARFVSEFLAARRRVSAE